MRVAKVGLEDGRLGSLENGREDGLEAGLVEGLEEVFEEVVLEGFEEGSEAGLTGAGEALEDLEEGLMGGCEEELEGG